MATSTRRIKRVKERHLKKFFINKFWFSGALNIPVAQGRKGYAVHEDINEPHTNYRAGIVNSPFLAGQTTKNIGVSSLISVQG